MATVTLSSADQALKEVYQPRIHDQLENAVKTVKRIERSSENVSSDSVGGKYVRFATRVKRNHGIGARTEMQALPAPQRQQYVDGQIKLSYQYGAIELSGQAFELASSNAQAFASLLDQEVNGIQEGLAKDVNRQMYGAPAGTLFTANAAGSTTTIVGTNEAALWLEVGMIIDIFDTSAAGLMTGGPFEITAIDKDTPSAGSTRVTYTGASGAATASGDTVHRLGSRNNEIEGFGSIVAGSGTLFNINPATYAVWTSEVDDPGALQSVSEGRMIAMLDRIDARGGKVSTVIFTSKGVRRAYFELLQQDRAIVNTQKFEGGFSGLGFTTDDGEVPVVSDNDCPNSTMWFVREDEMKLFNAGDWDWMARDGSRWRLVVDASGDYDAYRARLFRYFNLATLRRNTHGVIKNVLEG